MDEMINRIFDELKDLRKDTKEDFLRVEARLRSIETDLARLKVISAGWGAAGGGVLSVIVAVVSAYLTAKGVR